MHTRMHAHTNTNYIKSKKGLTETRTRIKEKRFTYTLLYCLPTELQRKLSIMLKVTFITMILYYVTPMMHVLLYNSFDLFPLSRAVNSHRLIFDPSEVEIHQYYIYPTILPKHVKIPSFLHFEFLQLMTLTLTFTLKAVRALRG